VSVHPNACDLLFGISAHRHDSVFNAQKPLQGGRQAKTQFLPGQYLAFSAKTGKSYAAYNRVPVLEQVGPASVEQRAEIKVERMSREDIANELVRDVLSLHPGELARFKYFSKISVLLDKFGALNLKISLREFRLKKHIPELHINFSPLDCFAK